MSLAYDNLIDNMYDGVYFVDQERRITFWNKAAEKITGFAAEEVIGSKCTDNLLKHVDKKGVTLCDKTCPLSASIRDGLPREAEVYLHHKQGHRILVSIRTIPMKDEQGRITGGAEVFAEVSSPPAMLARIKELEELALIDKLTQLSNRHHIETELNMRLLEMQRYGISFGLLFVEIVDLKQFNDTYGFPVGDLLIKMVADNLRSAIRPYDLVGRWGGGDFMAIIRNVDRRSLTSISERCLAITEDAYLTVENRMLGVTLSIGATVASFADTPVVLVERVQRMLQESNAKGLNCLTVG